MNVAIIFSMKRVAVDWMRTSPTVTAIWGRIRTRKPMKKKFKELGITEDMEIKGMCYGNALELLNP